ncbi:MAG: 50S ribosomal protein L29 [Clostridiales bacterium]|nr:50S ribosomal protein L29 [Clostridiales bacterium]
MKSKAYLEQLREKTVDELGAELVTQKKALFNLRFQKATNQTENTAMIRTVRKNIARIATIITQKQMELENQSSGAVQG